MPALLQHRQLGIRLSVVEDLVWQSFMSSQVKIAFDPGSSLTKAFYRVDDGQVTPFLIGSECLEVSAESIEERPKTGVVTPVNDAWVRLKKRGPGSSSCFAIGFLAEQLNASVQLREVKHKTAVLKLLAVIGGICEEEGIVEEDIELSVALMLPWNEFSDQATIKNEILTKSKRFYFRGQKIQCSVKNIVINAEGGGFVIHLLEKHGVNWFSSQSQICSLMIGHRNSSLLTFSIGKIDPKRSEATDLGFVQMVDKVRSRFSGYSREEMAKALYEIGDDISPNNKIVQRLVRRRYEDATSKEFDRLAMAIGLSRQEYIRLLKDWLKNLIDDPAVLCVGGGGGYYLRTFLSRYLKRSLVLGSPSEPVLESAEKFSDPSLSRRLIDVWYVFEYYYDHPADSEKKNLSSKELSSVQ